MRRGRRVLPTRSRPVALPLAFRYSAPMGDLQRFDRFADFILREFPHAQRIWDVAGGMGKLNAALTERGRHVLTFDARTKHLPVPFAERLLTLDEPCQTDLLVGLHPDGATRIVVEYAAQHRLPFAVIPCCSDNSMPYKPWMRHLAELAQQQGFVVQELELNISGRRRVLVGKW